MIFTRSVNSSSSPADVTKPTDHFFNELHCSRNALTDNLGWFLQFLLAALAFSALIGKRFCEPRYKRRPWIVWFYDISKQGVGATIFHLANVFISPHLEGNPCTWYVVNFMLDSTIGLLILWGGTKAAHYIAAKDDIPYINFGEYGTPPECAVWSCQCLLYGALATFAKSILVLLVAIPAVAYSLSTLRLSPIKDPNVELFVVLLLIPFLVNIFVFWVTDNFLMHHPRGVTSSTKTLVRYQSIKKKSASDDEENSSDERPLVVST